MLTHTSKLLAAVRAYIHTYKSYLQVTKTVGSPLLVGKADNSQSVSRRKNMLTGGASVSVVRAGATWLATEVNRVCIVAALTSNRRPFVAEGRYFVALNLCASLHPGASLHINPYVTVLLKSFASLSP